jgi:hypothetical protein
MDLLSMSAGSTKGVRVEVSARVTGGFEVVTAGTAWMAFVAAGAAEPATGTYTAAAWEAGGPPYHMRRNASALAVGRYDIWSRVVLGTEDVREKVGVLLVT